MFQPLPLHPAEPNKESTRVDINLEDGEASKK